MKRLALFIKWSFRIVIITGIISGASLGFFLFELSKTLPQNLGDELNKRNDVLPTVLYDREGNQIEELFIQRRIVIPYEQFPPHLIQALVASEDSRFFSHLGIDLLRIPKAFSCQSTSWQNCSRCQHSHPANCQTVSVKQGKTDYSKTPGNIACVPDGNAVFETGHSVPLS